MTNTQPFNQTGQTIELCCEYLSVGCIWLHFVYYHITYAFQSDSTLYNCLNVNELLARNRSDIWRLSDSSRIRTYNHLVCKWTLNHLAGLASVAKWLSVHLRTKWLCVRISLLSLELQISHLFWARSFLTFRQLQSVDWL